MLISQFTGILLISQFLAMKEFIEMDVSTKQKVPVWRPFAY